VASKKYAYLCGRKSRNTGAFEGGSTTIDDDGPPPEGCNYQIFIIKQIMYLDSAKKAELFEQFGGGATNTGSAESQIALFTYRIAHLTEHMKQNRKDHSTERALTGLVGKRRALLNYLKKRDIMRYRAIVKALGLRK
jgi:small subunit ribosomal protein S15